MTASTLDTVLSLLGLPLMLTLLIVVGVTAFRQVRPYRVVGHGPSMGMVAIRWRDDPDHTFWLTPASLQQQIGAHR
jgi:hypothetical protein